MQSTSTSLGLRARSSRRSWLLLGIFWALSCIASFIPTPGGWSDIRSQWLPPGLIAFASLGFLFTAQWSYWRGGQVRDLQAWALSIVFASACVMAAASLWEDVTFLRDVARSRNVGGERVQNKCAVT